MGPSREIEKLQRRWQENPLGLTFAPLAEAYRKEGMVADALELLEIGLAQHPNYVPAHIVRGRCFTDRQADGAAESAFARVLDLDPENGIALKGLADIAERAGRYPEAAFRLERLLDFDRSNEEARSQLDRIRARLVGLPSDPGLLPDQPIAVEPIAAEPIVVEQLIPEPPVLEVVEPAAEGDELVVPRAGIVEAGPEVIEVHRYDPIDLAAVATSEYQQIGDAEVLRSEAALGSGPDFRADAEAVVEPVPDGDEDARSVEADDDAAVAGVEADPDLVVTETMAEVFLRQGHRELALAVYTQLAGRTPNDRRIREAIGRLEAELQPSGPPSLPAFAAVLTGGTSVRAFFEQLLAAGRPRPSRDQLPQGLSLGAVFGEDGGAKPVAAAVESGPSYDEFYAEEPGLEAAPAAAQSGGDDLGAGDDLESFTSWLKGLRR